MGSDQHVTAKPERAPLAAFLVWAGKVMGAAGLGGATAAFTFYTTWQGMQTDLKAQGATILVHTVQIEALRAADAAQALALVRQQERDEADRSQLMAIRDDLQYIQRELIGTIRRP